MAGKTEQSFLKSLIRRLFHDGEPDLEERARKKLCTIFLLLIVIPLFTIGLNHLFTGRTIYGVVNITTTVVLLGFIPFLRMLKRGLILYRVISLILWLLLSYWIATAAISGYASIWAVLYPIFVFFLLGKKEGFVWSASIVLVCAVFFFNPFGFENNYQYQRDLAVRIFGTLLFALFLTYFYETVRAKYKEALEHDRIELQRHRDNLETLVAERTYELQRKNIELKRTLEQLQETSAKYLKSRIEKEKIQEQLAHSQKMEAVGTLAGGLAHDFNNLLGGIIGSFNLLDILLKKENLKNGKEIGEYLELGMESSKKSSSIIKQLLTLSRRQDITLSNIDINDTMKNVQSICRNSLPKSIGLDFRFSDEPITVMAEPVYMEQVLLNLCINGAHSMTIMRGEGETHGGTLTVTAEVVIPDEYLAEEEPETAGSDSWARIRVIDNGVGIPAENRARIFEPFYTTKKHEGGSGLGLAMSYAIIKQHGGFISVKSAASGGSIFSVFLPLAVAGASERHVDKAATAQHESSASGTILVIDDETFILNVVRGLLETQGWKAVTANTPDEGISIFRERHGEISGVVLDLSMPGKSGIRVYRELAAIDPEVKVILCSGLIDNDVRDGALAAGIKKILHKPFDGESLFAAVHDLLKENINTAPGAF